MSQKRVLLVSWFAVVSPVLVGPFLARAADVPGRPNVILVLTDDQGYGDVGVHGNDKIKTPNLDRFAQEGVQLRHFYCSPVCAPTRASLRERYNDRFDHVRSTRNFTPGVINIGSDREDPTLLDSSGHVREYWVRPLQASIGNNETLMSLRYCWYVADFSGKSEDCHPERSEGSHHGAAEILRRAQNDMQT